MYSSFTYPAASELIPVKYDLFNCPDLGGFVYNPLG